MIKEKNHVGRPTNEEVRQRRNKKIFKVCIPVFVLLSLFIIIFFITNNDSNKLKGASVIKSDKIMTYSVVKSKENPDFCHLNILELKSKEIKYQIICGANARPTSVILSGEKEAILKNFHNHKGYTGIHTYESEKSFSKTDKITLNYKKQSRGNANNGTATKVTINLYNKNKANTTKEMSKTKGQPSSKCSISVSDINKTSFKWNFKCDKDAKPQSLRLTETYSAKKGSLVKSIEGSFSNNYGMKKSGSYNLISSSDDYRLELYFGTKSKDYYMTYVDFTTPMDVIEVKNATKIKAPSNENNKKVHVAQGLIATKDTYIYTKSLPSKLEQKVATITVIKKTGDNGEINSKEYANGILVHANDITYVNNKTIYVATGGKKIYRVNKDLEISKDVMNLTDNVSSIAFDKKSKKIYVGKGSYIYKTRKSNNEYELIEVAKKREMDDYTPQGIEAYNNKIITLDYNESKKLNRLSIYDALTGDHINSYKINISGEIESVYIDTDNNYKLLFMVNYTSSDKGTQNDVILAINIPSNIKKVLGIN